MDMTKSVFIKFNFINDTYKLLIGYGAYFYYSVDYGSQGTITCEDLYGGLDMLYFDGLISKTLIQILNENSIKGAALVIKNNFDGSKIAIYRNYEYYNNERTNNSYLFIIDSSFNETFKMQNSLIKNGIKQFLFSNDSKKLYVVLPDNSVTKI